MVGVEQCCCCSVRTGSLVCGVVLLLGCVLQLGNDLKEVVRYGITNIHQKNEAVDIFYNEKMENMDVERDEIRMFFKLSFYIAIPDLLLCLGIILAAASLLYGVARNKEKFIFPAIIILPFDLLHRVVSGFVLCITLGIGHPISVFLCLLFLYGIILDISAWLCVFSYCQQLREQAESEAAGTKQQHKAAKV